MVRMPEWVVYGGAGFQEEALGDAFRRLCMLWRKGGQGGST